MIDHHDNVVVLLRRDGVVSWPAAQNEIVLAAVGQLEKLGCHLQQLSPRPGWSAQRWMIASTPFRMRIAATVRMLSDLAKISSAAGQGDARWAFELSEACFRAIRLLNDIDACLQMLRGVDTPPAERVRETRFFASNRSEVLKVLDKIRCLIAQQVPAEQSDG
jgi:hypothetical protein